TIFKCDWSSDVCSSDLHVVFDSMPKPIYKDRYYLPSWDIPRTVEYQQASLSLQGIALRHNVANLCIGVKEGSRYRMVHVSEYIRSEERRVGKECIYVDL